MRSALLLSIAVLGCTDASSSGEPPIASGTIQRELRVRSLPRLDVLFVIESSPAMAPHQDHLRAQYRRIIDELRGPDGMPDLRIGVITADVGTRGANATIPGCSPQGDDAVLRGVLRDEWGAEGVRIRNYEGDLADAFVRIADVGTNGCAVAQPLEAARRTLVESPGGFLRDDTQLAIVFVGASDDCSFADPAFLDGATDASRCTTRAAELAPIETYESALRGLVTAPGRLHLGGALGAGPRLPALLDRFGDRAIRVALTDDDLAPVVAHAPLFVTTLEGPPCFARPLLDVDPTLPATQHACTGWTSFATAPARGELLPECAATGTAPCWKLDPDPQGTCPGPVLRFERGDLDVPPGMRVTVECAVR